MSAVEILSGLLMLLLGGMGAMALWLLSEINRTLREHIKKVEDIDKRVVRLEARAGVRA